MNELKLNGKILSDRYQIKGKISSGSYAEVFIASDLHSPSKDVAIKALNPHLQGTCDFELEKHLIENFEKEAAILKSISHPNIVALLDEGEASDLLLREFYFIVLEYMPGRDLLDLTRTQSNGCLSLGQTLNYIRQISDGLSHAHQLGIIHRDLKPNNFLLTADHRTVKVADFGVAKLTSDEAGEITRIGTATYSAPEHSPNAPEATIGMLTVSADIYSLAKSCFSLVCGRSPSEFAGKQITDLPPTVKTQPWANAFLDVLKRATATQVEMRYGSVSEFWNDLGNLASLDEQALKPITSKKPAPEEQELAKKRVELAPLESMLAQRELDLLTLQAELNEFESIYLRIVGVRYAELDEIEAQIAEAEAELNPKDSNAKERAAEARQQADESAHTTKSVKEPTYKGKFNPPDSLKQIYRELARIIHPDLVLDKVEKERRHKLMADANKAYEEGNEELLASMLDQWQNSPETVKGEGVAAELIRLIRRIAQAGARLKTIEKDIVTLEGSELYELRSKVHEAELESRDLLVEMAAQIERQIAVARDRLNDEVLTKVKDG